MPRTLSPRALALNTLSTPHIITSPARHREGPGDGLVASARRLTATDVKGQNRAATASASKTAPWQQEAWELLDMIGEQRFLAHTLAGRMSQARLYVGKLPANASPGTRPENVSDQQLQHLLDAIGDGVAGQGQLLHRMGLNLFVAGEGWLVGIPPRFVPGTSEYAAVQSAFGPAVQVDRSAAPEDESEDVLKMVWRMLSVDEVSVDQSEEATLKLEGGETAKVPVSNLYMIRVWRPHPRRAWEADSPTRASLPVLRELFGLTQHVSAQIDSRLAGAGLLVISTSADAELKRIAGIPENSPRSLLMEALQVTMQTPIKDRSNASALVPLTLTVPDEVVDKIKHITFSTPLDKETPKLRDEAIRRLALGQDAPPELLLGTGGMNHWGAWLVREDVVTTHLEPPLALICDALTVEYLRPLIQALRPGISDEELSEYVVWYDVDHLIERPNRSGDAKDLYDRKELSGKALREATGFEEGDAPEVEKEMDLAVSTAMSMVAQAPSLAQSPGLTELVRQLREVLNGEESTAPAPAEAPEGEAVEESTAGPLPDTQDSPPPAGTPGNPDGDAA